MFSSVYLYISEINTSVAKYPSLILRLNGVKVAKEEVNRVMVTIFQ